MAPLQDTILNPQDSNAAGSPIQQFYGKKSVFMTGATGFLGKVLIEKLLRTCDVESIYILIRSKKDDDIHTRLGKIFDDPLFDQVRKEVPKFRHKIIPISGDCILPGLGIEPNERALLIKNVNVVFHVAATVRFDEKLKLALAINVCGTKEILTLAKEMENLKAIVHTSTAYANCNHQVVEERFYKTPLTGDSSLKLAEVLDDATLDKMTPELLQDWPNTYTYTKSLAEDLVKNNSKGLPLAVFRPAIVIPTYKEPIEGWIDNMYGPTGIVIGVAAGLLRVLHIHKDNRAEIVPVDLCVNSMIASAYDVSCNTYDEPPIYNFVASTENAITWNEYCEISIKHGINYPLSKMAWFFTFTMTSSKALVTILTYFYHLIPAALVDIGLFLSGKKPRLLDTYRKIHKLSDVLSYFTNRVWTFHNSNVKNLYKKLDDRDKELFYFDMDTIDWDHFLKNSMYGMRKYLMKEDPKTIPEARQRVAKLQVLHYMTVYLFRGGFVYLLYRIFSKFILSKISA